MPVNNLTKILSAILIIAALLSVVFGSILPFLKAERYVNFARVSPSATTIEEFESDARNALDFSSPIGQEETTKFILSGIRDILHNPNLPTSMAEELVRFIEPYAFKNDVRHLAAMGDMYSVLWAKYGDESAFAKSEEYYRKALAIGPNLPPILYSLMTIYQIKDDKAKINEVAKTILSYWPNDDFTRNLLSSTSTKI